MSTSQPHMTAGARVRAALAGAPVDRVPLVFWHHFKPEGSGERMAHLTKEFFYDKFQLDIVKIMPDLPYPELGQGITAAQLADLPRLGLETPIFQEQLTCIRQLRAQLGEEYPLILTIFSPLTYALRWIGRDKVLEAARQNPQAFEQGLPIIAENLPRAAGCSHRCGSQRDFLLLYGGNQSAFHTRGVRALWPPLRSPGPGRHEQGLVKHRSCTR